MQHDGVFMLEIQFIFVDTNKMPLGKLSKNQIAKGIEVSSLRHKKCMHLCGTLFYYKQHNCYFNIYVYIYICIYMYIYI